MASAPAAARAATPPVNPLARFGPWGEPNCAILYGPSGLGKTYLISAALACARQGAVMFALPGAAKALHGMLALPSQRCIDPVDYLLKLKASKQQFIGVIEVSNLEQVIAHLLQMSNLPVELRPDVGIDDLTILAENTAQGLKPQFVDATGAFYKDTAFRFWDAVKERVATLKQASRFLGIHVYVTAHGVSAETDQKGRYFKGGPKLPSRAIIDAIPHIFDDVLRMDAEPSRWPFKAIFRVDSGNISWHEKTRHGVVFRAVSAANLAEGMRLAGYVMPRPVGLEWIEDVATTVCSELERGTDFKTLAKSVETALLGAGRHPAHAYWGIVDGRDRFELTRASRSLFPW